MPSVADCIGHGNSDPCHCFERVSSTRPIVGMTPPERRPPWRPPPFVQQGMHLDEHLTDPLVAGEAIPAGTEVIIKDGKLYARPATPLELMTKQRDELLVALDQQRADFRLEMTLLTEALDQAKKTLTATESTRDNYSRQISDLIRKNNDLRMEYGDA